MSRMLFACYSGVVMFTSTAVAHPEGAPWGSADGMAACVSCHFDVAPIEDSEAIILEGVPHTPVAGESYDLSLSFTVGEAPMGGFLATALSGEDRIGTFTPQEETLEANGGEIRSVIPFRGEGPAQWRFRWQLPEKLPEKIYLHVAANAGNDDQSPFGDQVHFRTYLIGSE